MLLGMLSSLLGQVSAYTNTNPKKQAKQKVMSKGWGEDYPWRTLDEGLTEAHKLHKPVMVIIHRQNCYDCIKLRKRFAKSPKMHELAKQFVLVNMESHEVPQDVSFSPDGYYVPRVLFFTPSGYLMKDIRNQYRKIDLFTYSDPAFITDSMKDAINVNNMSLVAQPTVTELKDTTKNKKLKRKL